MDLRSSRDPLKVEIVGSNPTWVTQRSQVVELVDTRRTERRAPRAWEFDSPLGYYSERLASRLGLISPVRLVRIQGSLLEWSGTQFW